MIKDCYSRIKFEAKEYIAYTKRIHTSHKPFFLKAFLVHHKYNKTLRRIKKYVKNSGKPIMKIGKTAKSLFDECLKIFK